VSYLARVADVFGMRLEYLATGREPKTGTGEFCRNQAQALRGAVVGALGVRLGSEDTYPESIPFWVAPLGEVVLRLRYQELLLDPDPAALSHGGGDVTHLLQALAASLRAPSRVSASTRPP
jgi:hypothetical protein